MTPADDGDAPDGLWGRARGLLDPVLTVHDEHPVYFWLGLVGAVAALLGLGALVRPDLVVDQFLWRNFWGPTVADANQSGSAVRNGVQAGEGYTLVSEVTYGLILAGALLSIYHHVIKKRGIEADGGFIGAMVPYVLLGPTARALEDASAFCVSGTTGASGCDPGVFSYVFISPIIYLAIAAAVLVHLLLAHRVHEADRAKRLTTVGGWLGVQVLAYTAAYATLADQFSVLASPVTVAVLALAAVVVYTFATDRGGDHVRWATAVWGLPMVGTAIALIAHWELVGPWVEPTRDAVWQIAPTTIVGVALAVALVGLVGWWGRSRSTTLASFASPLNLTLVAGHMVDAVATFTALCSDPDGPLCTGASFLGFGVAGYGEKHPVSEVFLGTLDGWGYVVMKLVLVCAIVVLVDHAERDGEDPDLIGIVKLAVLVLGLAPGTRNLVRVFMGV
jgi:uncharacterized membrane protein